MNSSDLHGENAERLLDIVYGLHWGDKGYPYQNVSFLGREDLVIIVGDLLSLRSLGSQATPHGRVKNLRYLDYVDLIDQGDARIKRVIPTGQAYKCFEMSSVCMERALEAPA